MNGKVNFLASVLCPICVLVVWSGTVSAGGLTSALTGPKSLFDIGKVICRGTLKDGSYLSVAVWDIPDSIGPGGNVVSGKDIAVRTTFRGNDGYDPIFGTSQFDRIISETRQVVSFSATEEANPAGELKATVYVDRLSGSPLFDDGNLPKASGAGYGLLRVRSRVYPDALMVAWVDCSFASKAEAAGI